MADPLNRGPENVPESGPSILRQELSAVSYTHLTLPTTDRG